MSTPADLLAFNMPATGTAVSFIVLAVVIVLAIFTLPRHPWIREWRKEREEGRILDRQVSEMVRARATFYAGSIPHYEDCEVPGSEAAEFARIAGAYDFGWIELAVRGAEKGRQE